jgi:DNA-binding GntR family transcriptional regulator
MSIRNDAVKPGKEQAVRGTGAGKVKLTVVADKAATRPKGTGTRHVHDAIQQRILSLELPPGSDLDEASLVRSFGVSRTPVREALIRLASAGLVVLLPNRGARVAPLELSHIRSFFEALELCQRAVTRWAAARRTDADLVAIDRHRQLFEKMAAKRDQDGMNPANRDFHLAIASACGNTHLQEAYGRLLNEGFRLSRLSLAYGDGGKGPTDLDQIVDDHRLICRHIADGNLDKADGMATTHTNTFRARINVYLQSNLSKDMKL